MTNEQKIIATKRIRSPGGVLPFRRQGVWSFSSV